MKDNSISEAVNPNLVQDIEKASKALAALKPAL